jgi:hypothetical protein
MDEQHEPMNTSEPSLEDFQRARALPPPAFPPGFRRVSIRRRLGRQGRRDIALSPGALASGHIAFPDEAFISPDAPIERQASADPYISPDEPISHRRPRSAHLDEEGIDPDDVVVTGMGDDAHLEPEELGLSDDSAMVTLTEQVVGLAEALRFRGEAGLREHPGMSRFEATLRAYCKGYLTGRRAEDERF